MEKEQTTSKIMLGGNLEASEKFGDNIVQGAICLDVLNDEKVQSLIYEYEGKRYLNIKVVKRKEMGKFNQTHYIEVDTFVPKKKGE